MKTFKQFINEIEEVSVLRGDELEKLHKQAAGYIAEYKSQARGVLAKHSAAIDKCIALIDNAPYEAMKKAAGDWYSSKKTSDLVKLTNIKNGLSNNARKIESIKGTVDNFNVPADGKWFGYTVEKLKYSDPDFVAKVNANRRNFDPWYGGRFKLESVLYEAPTTPKGPYPSVPARKGAVFISDPPGTKSFAGYFDIDLLKSSYEYWLKLFGKVQENASNIKAMFQHNKDGLAKYANPLDIISSIEKNFNKRDYHEAYDYCCQLKYSESCVEATKRAIGMLASRYVDIFSEILALGK